MPTTALAVAWPSVADDIGREIADLGLLVGVHSLGTSPSAS
jgi:hypothetical protein